VSIDRNSIDRAVARLRLRSRWRCTLAYSVLLSLVWPAAAMLPWQVFELDRANAHVVALADHHHDSDEPSHHHDASDIPGSPTHPEDHDCFECQVLQHLSRCVLPDMGPVVLPPRPDCFVAPGSYRESHRADAVALRPPIRGPPLLTA